MVLALPPQNFVLEKALQTSYEITNIDSSMKSNHFTIVSESSYLEILKSKFIMNTVIDIKMHLENISEPAAQNENFLLILKETTLNENLDALIPWFEKIIENVVSLMIISEVPKDKKLFDSRIHDYISFVIPENISTGLFYTVVDNAYHAMYIFVNSIQLNNELTNVYQDLRSVTKVGQALLTEKDFDTLLTLILTQAKEIVNADGGSIYIVEPSEIKGQKPTKLRFKKSALHLTADEFLLDIDKNSIAGYVALIGHHLRIDDVYKLSGKEEYRFNPDYDKNFNYHTKSMMLIPMKNHHDEVIGVIQLINKKLDKNRPLTVEDMKGKWVIPFTDKCYQIISALAGQAGVAIENNILMGDIRNLFEGFVKASVKAIEQRDPTTSGHSARVADYAESMAKALDRESSGLFSSTRFTPDQLRELRYAALLHDFGKVGVREKVLVKAKKLYPMELDLIEWRFRYIRKTLEKELIEKKFNILKNHGSDILKKEEKSLDDEFHKNLDRLNAMFEAVTKANEPSVLEEGDFKTLETLTNKMVMLENGIHVPFLERNEFLSLSIKKGTLDANERLEIESHVTHTYQFLNQIPWTHDLAHVPEIAHGHHEKLDGTGYPLGINAPKINVQTRIMTIADIFDALTAWDRPYKKAVPFEHALNILNDEAKNNKVDSDILKIFISAEIYKKFQSSLIF